MAEHFFVVHTVQITGQSECNLNNDGDVLSTVNIGRSGVIFLCHRGEQVPIADVGTATVN